MANLARFASGPCPEEPGVAAQLHFLYNAEFDRGALREAMRLMAMCPWSTLMVEQLHGSCAHVRRFHPEYGRNMLKLKAFSHAIVRLLPAHTDTEKRIE
eukprot:6153960-Amphidinium_carterae.1